MDDYLEYCNLQLNVALKLMQISLENEPIKYKELSQNLRNTNDEYIIDTFYPEILIFDTIYSFFHNRNLSLDNNENDWDSQACKLHIELNDSLMRQEGLENCPDNLTDYLLAIIDQNYKHQYAKYDSKLLRRMAEIVVNETDLKKRGDELKFFPLQKISANITNNTTLDIMNLDVVNKIIEFDELDTHLRLSYPKLIAYLSKTIVFESLPLNCGIIRSNSQFIIIFIFPKL